MERSRRGGSCGEVERSALRNRPLWLDGYNVLTTVEAALGGGVILIARDGAYRDMASMHGSYRKVAETLPALKILGKLLEAWAFLKAFGSWIVRFPTAGG